MEYVAPTGSFKDRGASMLVSALRAARVGQVIEDSSGNAAASLAAYCAQAGMACRIFAPAGASPVKLAQATACGAQVVQVAGGRQAARHAAQQTRQSGAYVGHAYNPFFVAGLRTIAFESWQQLGRVPESVVVPVGNGTLFLGLYHGFLHLQRAGVSERVPRMFAVQSNAAEPICRAFRRDLDQPVSVRAGDTIADGARVVDPPRGAEVLAGLKATGGIAVSVSDREIRWVVDAMARKGILIEPTSGLGLAGLRKLDKVIQPDEVVLVPLTGSGLKVALSGVAD
jgi:threonine synthase